MRAIRVLANLHVDDLESAKEFYAGFLGLSEEMMNLGWVARYASADGAAQVQLHPLTTEEWGVHRFLVRAPDGTVVNVVGHAD